MNGLEFGYLVRLTRGSVHFRHEWTYRVFAPLVRLWDRLRHGVICPGCEELVSPADLFVRNRYDRDGDIEDSTICCGVCGHEDTQEEFQLTTLEGVRETH